MNCSSKLPDVVWETSVTSAVPGAEWYPAGQMTPCDSTPGNRSSGRARLHACVRVPQGGVFINSGSRSSDMPVYIHCYVCARSNLSLCVCCLCPNVSTARDGGEQGWAGLSWLSERSLCHCRSALYRISLWSRRSKMILEKEREERNERYYLFHPFSL